MTTGHKRRSLVINATCIGRRLDGIGNYALNMITETARINTCMRVLIILNRSAGEHLKGLEFPNGIEIKWTTALMSPDHGFRGHLLRLIYSNLLGLKFRRDFIFSPSPLGAVFFGRNQVITVHDIIPLLFREKHRGQFYFYKYLLKYALSRAKLVIAPSYHTGSLLESYYGIGQKVRVIYNGIKRIYPGRDGAGCVREKIILFLGRTSPMKNIASLLKAFVMIRDRIEHSLYIVGNCENNCLNGSDDDRVVMTGYLPDDKIIELYMRAELFVFPSLYEGFGLPPVEAMACGCPVVASNTGSIPEICGDAVYYVNPHDEKSIADGMLKVLNDPDLRRQLSRRGLVRARMYRAEISAIEHIRLFEHAVNNRD